MFEGIVILVNAVQSLNIKDVIFVKDACDDNVTVASEIHLANTLPLHVSTVFGRVIDVNPEL